MIKVIFIPFASEECPAGKTGRYYLKREAVLLLKEKTACKSSKAEYDPEAGQPDRLLIRLSETGKPAFADLPQLHFSVSYANGAFAVSFSDEETGIDIEQVPRKDISIPHHMFAADEYAYIHAAGHIEEKMRRYTEMWTRKEAYLKMLGVGLAIRPDSFSVRKPPVSGQVKSFPLHLEKYPDRTYFLSVSGKSLLTDTDALCPVIRDIRGF